MIINSELVKKLRAAKPWSQEQLSEACGLDLRTIQRIENKGKASIESVRALATVFEIDPHELMVPAEKEYEMTPFMAVKTGFVKFADFSGIATRFEYWWFFIFVLMVTAVATLIHETLAEIITVICLIPLLAAGSRRLNDTGQSGWWQLLFLAPFGFVPVLIMLALESEDQTNQSNTKKLEIT
ncbi:MAG: DUF805 domain-containing protein [Anaerolineae bacterium]|nr:DUF805 domain-containing protein [Anaerolineae bacterium]